jgi:hypothetical protein
MYNETNFPVFSRGNQMDFVTLKDKATEWNIS